MPKTLFKFVLSSVMLLAMTVTLIGSDTPPKSNPSHSATGLNIPRPVDSELAQHLEKWQEATSQIRRIDIQFKRVEYDPVFEVECVGSGFLSMDRRNRGMFQVKPIEDVKGMVSRKQNSRGKRYAVKPCDESDWWYWTGRSVFKIEAKSRSFEEIPIPVSGRSNSQGRWPDRPSPPPLPENVVAKALPGLNEIKPNFGQKNELLHSIQDILSNQTWSDYAVSTPFDPMIQFLTFMYTLEEWKLPRSNIWFFAIDIPMKPFLLGMTEQELQARFDVTLEKKDGPRVQLKFVPKLSQDRAICEQIILMVDSTDYKPIAVKWVHPTGTKSSVYVFTNVEINRREMGDADPLRMPDLHGYKRNIHPGE